MIDVLRSPIHVLQRIGIGCLVPLILACDAPEPETSAQANTPVDAQQAFWLSLEALCGSSFTGMVVESEPPDASFDTQRLVMHVRECGEDTIRIPFHVGENRSRTWVITRTVTGLRLKHDHRHEDGSEDEITQYGGNTHGPGTASSQDFYADSLTGGLVPAASANIWTIEIEPGVRFSYGLRRTNSARRFRADFDLSETTDTPPPPWGR